MRTPAGKLAAGKLDVYMLKQKHFEEVLSKYFQIKGFDYDKELYNAEGLTAMSATYCAVKKHQQER